MTPTALKIEGGLLAVTAPGPTGVRCFKGIPYARPPVGDSGGGRRSLLLPGPAFATADAFGPNSHARRRFRRHRSRARPASPRTASTSTSGRRRSKPRPPIPVMVWIHGGGFVVGSGADPRYDGDQSGGKGHRRRHAQPSAQRARFLAHPELTAESPGSASGNYGVLDLVAALDG